MKSWKWSTGEPYYKSARPEKKEPSTIDPSYEYDSQQNAINQSLADDSFFNQESLLNQDSLLNQESLLNQDLDLINITNSMFSRNQNSCFTTFLNVVDGSFAALINAQSC